MTYPKEILKLIKKVREALAPPTTLSIPEWVFINRRLPSETTAEMGYMDTGRTPYLIELYKAALDPNIRRITLRTSTQVAKSELLNNVFFFFAANRPGPALMVQPTKEFAKNYGKEKIKPSIMGSPKIRDLFYRDRELKGTMLVYPYRGGFLKLAGSNVAADLASSAIRLLLLDEVDRFAKSTGEEGSPIAIARKRTDTFTHNYLEIMTSTPTNPDAPISVSFEQGTQEHYHVPCPLCGHMQKLEFKNLEWEKNDKGQPLIETAKYLCCECNELFTQSKHSEMLAKGVWIAENVPLIKSHRSFQLNQLYSPFTSWVRMAGEFIESKSGGMEGEKLFVNTSLGLPFKAAAHTPDWEEIFNKRDSYEIGGKINPKIGIIVMGVDVQANYVKAEVFGVGRGLEMWHIDEIKIPGKFEDDGPEFKKALDMMVNHIYETEDGRDLPISRTWWDCNWNTENVCNWITHEIKYSQTKVICGRGAGDVQVNQLITYPSPNNKRQIYTANVDDIKENLFFRLRKLKRDFDTPYYIHLGNMPEDFFKQLCSEEQIITMNKKTGALQSHWTKIYTNGGKGRNEVLDCLVYALACIAVMELKKWTASDWDTQFSSYSHQAVVKHNAVPTKPKAVASSHMSDNGGSGSHW